MTRFPYVRFRGRSPAHSRRGDPVRATGPSGRSPGPALLPQVRSDDRRRLLLSRALARVAMGPRSPEHRPARLRVHPLRRVRLGPARAVRGDVRLRLARPGRRPGRPRRAQGRPVHADALPARLAGREVSPRSTSSGATAGACEHGTRANGSLANDVFVRYTKRIVEELGRRYGRDPRVWGWQLDNEPYGPARLQPLGPARIPGLARAQVRHGRQDERGLGRRVLEHAVRRIRPRSSSPTRRSSARTP
ncbi:MAG: beta-galactosidase [Candidatus Moduliflexus flocculans]|nr:beta-galactosidase [Candidatus Moduliflexus flocculans]